MGSKIYIDVILNTFILSYKSIIYNIYICNRNKIIFYI